MACWISLLFHPGQTEQAVEFVCSGLHVPKLRMEIRLSDSYPKLPSALIERKKYLYGVINLILRHIFQVGQMNDPLHLHFSH